MPGADDAHTEYARKGWHVFDRDARLTRWVNASLGEARKTINDPINRKWLRHGGTWFAGVNVFNNDALGALGQGPRLHGNAVRFIEELTGKPLALDKGQLSVCYPGYPKPSPAESDLAFAYRCNRDAAHIDGILKEGQERYLREFHDYIFAIPMVDVDHLASPFVVWSGSHSIVRRRLLDALSGYRAAQWSQVPIKQVYQALRKEIFDSCERVEVHLKVGQALVAHRLLLHGTSPWRKNAMASEDGRMMCFFRPATLGIEQWLSPTI